MVTGNKTRSYELSPQMFSAKYWKAIAGFTQKFRTLVDNNHIVAVKGYGNQLRGLRTIAETMHTMSEKFPSKMDSVFEPALVEMVKNYPPIPAEKVVLYLDQLGHVSPGQANNNSVARLISVIKQSLKELPDLPEDPSFFELKSVLDKLNTLSLDEYFRNGKKSDKEEKSDKADKSENPTAQFLLRYLMSKVGQDPVDSAPGGAMMFSA